MVCIVLFTVEYAIRVITSPFVTYTADNQIDIDYSRMDRVPVKAFSWGRLFGYLIVPMNVVDFFAIAPFYIDLLAGEGGGFSFLRVLRLARVFRIFKMGKYSSGAKLLGRTLVNSFPALQLIVFFR